MSEQRMRAVVIAGHGGVENLEVREVERPRAEGDRVLVRVRAAALNRADLLQRRGRYPAPPGALQEVPGLEFAGEIVECGAEARAWKSGERVFGITAGGAQAEYAVVPESALARVPDNLSWEEAAAVPEAFITAHDAMFTQGRLTIGERVAVHAAGSGVGLAALQLARAAGAQVFGTARTAAKLERAREYGLDEGVVVAGDPQVFADAVRERTAGAGIDLILDLVGASYLAANLDALAPRGRLILVGTMGGAAAELNFGVVMSKRLRLRGTVLRGRSTEEKARAVRLFAAQVVPLIARAVMRPVVDSVFDMADVRAAHTRMETNESFGKIVLTVNHQS
ncbi:MAG: NAD(P)H-quinone oxidoreductase [Pyrinomonadaceae bacterium]